LKVMKYRPFVSLLRFLLVPFAQFDHEFLRATDHEVQYFVVYTQLFLLVVNVVCDSALFRQLCAQTVTNYDAGDVLRPALL